MAKKFVPKSDALHGELDAHGPMLASQLQKRLLKTGVSEEAARKRISRAVQAGVLHRALVNFPHNDTFLYLEDQFGSALYWEKLLGAFNSTGSVFGICINSILGKGGGVRRPFFDTVSGSPALQKGHLSSNSVLSKLELLKVLQEVPGDDQSAVVTFHPFVPLPQLSFSQLKAVELAEQILLLNVKEWFQKLGIVSYGKVTLRDLQSAPKFARCSWDLVAPSYTYPLVRKDAKKVSPGFVVADVNLTARVEARHVAYFVNKCRLTRSVPNYPPFMAFFLAQGFSPEALSTCRKEGILAVTTENLFGQDIADALTQLIAVLQNAAAAVIQDPNRVFELIGKLSKIQGAATNLRGALFEMICAYCLKQTEGLDVNVGVRAASPQTNKVAEIDVYGRSTGNVQVIACECKGYPHKSIVPAAEIAKWRNKIPIVMDWIQATRPQHSQIKKRFEFWTPGKVDKYGLAELAQAKKEAGKKYHVDWHVGKDFRKLAQALAEKSLLDTLDQHYFQK